jgi:predicted AlkP superfamily pyrophosphatase or phosphodiesterase
MIDRYSRGYTANGFNYLLENGVVYTDARQRHANTETVVGHTTLSTGTDPGIHGMVANNWRDNRTKLEPSTEGHESQSFDVNTSYHYATRDVKYPIIPIAGEVYAETDGRSARDILVSTIGDEILLSSGSAAKVFGISAKDRAAIGSTGHAGTAFWFDDKALSFVTSEFYLESYPDWHGEWVKKNMALSYQNTAWTLLLDPSNYIYADRDDMIWETDYPNWTRFFPHNFGTSDFLLFPGFIRTSPAMDVITLDFAKALIDGENLGEDNITDYLAVSLNSVDYIGHAFGPSSLEAEDNLKQLDKQLDNFFAYLDAKIGLENVLIVLAADHGATEIPLFMNTVFREDAGLFDFANVEKRPSIVNLKSAHGITEQVSRYTHPFVYLDRQVLLEAGLDKADVTNLFASEISKMAGVTSTFTFEEIATGSMPRSDIALAVTRNFHPERAGDIYVILDPLWFVKDDSPAAGASQHGSPYAYDSHIPIMFAGPGIDHQVVSRRVEAIDVAPTIANYLSVKLPSGSIGKVLTEVLGQ